MLTVVGLLDNGDGYVPTGHLAALELRNRTIEE
jgi:hypothetical protein